MSATTQQPVAWADPQPVPDRIESVEAALRVIGLDPNPDSRETAYAMGYLDGSLAGQRYCFGVCTDRDARQRDEAYATHLRPLPLPAALEKHRDPRVLVTVGWLAGWRDATVGAREALECSVCARRLFAEHDSVHRCNVDFEWLCASSSMDCYRDVCAGPTHGRECYDEVSI